jgi:hypothetical protein
VSMRKRASFGSAAGVRHQQHLRRPALLGGVTQVGNFDERQWGTSVSTIKGTGLTERIAVAVLLGVTRDTARAPARSARPGPVHLELTAATAQLLRVVHDVVA